MDIGEEFTKMIVVQRAFSAAAKIISTADEMLEELDETLSGFPNHRPKCQQNFQPVSGLVHTRY